jgi:hypothetical protein
MGRNGTRALFDQWPARGVRRAMQLHFCIHRWEGPRLGGTSIPRENRKSGDVSECSRTLVGTDRTVRTQAVCVADLGLSYQIAGSAPTWLNVPGLERPNGVFATRKGLSAGLEHD